MARSSTGLPYLILRPDTGKFAYWRELPIDLVPFMKGDLVLPWSTKGQRSLNGLSRVLKVSLKTGDEAMARVRWTHVHAQVEALVQLGRVLVNEKAERERPRTTTERLSPDAIATVAGQARQDLLADHDRSWIDPSFTTPLTGVVLNLMRKAGIASRGNSVQAAQRFADNLLLRETKNNLADRDPGLLDAEIVEAELDPDPTLLDLDALRRGEASKMTSEQMKYLATAAPTGRLPSEVEERLEENGHALPGTADRRALALALLRSRMAGLRDIKARDAGGAIATPPRPASVAPPQAAASAKPVLSSMQAYWVKDRRPGEKDIADRSLYLRYFIDLFGDLPVDEITSPMMADFLMQLELSPRNAPHALRQAKLQDRVAWAAKPEHQGRPKLSRRTVNSKGLGSVSALMEQARKLGHVLKNPCEGMALTIKPGDVVKRLPYSLQDLRKIFSSGVYAYTNSDRSSIRRGPDHWLPLLAMFTGARLEELGQLLVGDVKTIDGIPCLTITDIPDEDTGPTSHASKSVKTAAGRRTVPVHETLIRCNFLHFVEAQRSCGVVRLFPELPRYRERVTKEWSKAWGRFTDKHVTASPSKTFHSFRHLFIAKLRAARVDQNVIKTLVGHAVNDVTLEYGVEHGCPFGAEVLNSALQTFSIEGLDLSDLYQRENPAQH